MILQSSNVYYRLYPRIKMTFDDSQEVVVNAVQPINWMNYHMYCYDWKLQPLSCVWGHTINYCCIQNIYLFILFKFKIKLHIDSYNFYIFIRMCIIFYKKYSYWCVSKYSYLTYWHWNNIIKYLLPNYF